jgi:Transglycosylase SLT domain
VADGSVTGEFRLVTVQARRELDRLEREAKDTDRAMEKLGHDMDSVGSTRQVRQVRSYRTETHRMGRASREAKGDVASLRAEVSRLSTELEKATRGSRGGGGGGGGGVRGGVLGLSGGMKQMGAMALIALPAVRSLTGAVVALGGAVASASAGGAAVGAAGLGGLLAGIGGIAAVAVPMTKAVKEAAEAQKKYNQAVRDYGRASKEAGAARGEARLAFSRTPRGTRSMIAEANAFGEAWRKATRTGQEALVGFAREAIRTARRMTPFLSRMANAINRAFAAQGGRFLDFLGGRRVRRGLRAGTGIFTENLGNVRRVGQATVEIFLNIMRAAKPFFKEFTNFAAQFFGRQAARTRNIDRMRDSIRVMVGDLKSLGQLGGAGGRLILTLLGQGRRTGRSLIDDATRQLNRWTDWLKANPAKVQSFFRDTAQGTRDIAAAMKNLAGIIADLSRDLMPLLTGLREITTLASQVGAVGTVGLGSAALGAFRGARGRPKGPGPLGTLVGGVLGRGGGAARGGAGSAKMAAGIAGLGGGVGRGVKIGGALRGAAMGAGKAYWPIAAIMAGLGFAGTDGGLQRRATGAAAMLIPGIKRPKAYSELEAIGQERAAQFAGGVAQDGTLTGARAGASRVGGEASRLRRALGATRTIQQVIGPGGATRARQQQIVRGDRRVEVTARASALEAEARARQQVVEQLVKERDERLKDVSRERAGRYATQFQEGFRRRVRRGATAQQAFGITRRAVGRQMAGMQPEGATALGQSTLDWANKLRRDNPKLQGEYEKLASGIEKRLRTLGSNVRVVQGQILDGSAKQWGQISSTISSAARRGVDKTSVEFQRLQKLALGALEQMGYSGGEAKKIFASKRLRSKAAEKTGAGQLSLQSEQGMAAAHGYKGPLGEGIGIDRPTLATVGSKSFGNTTAGSGLNLMGAKPGMGVYARDAATYGLRVTSGARPGDMTSSGNVSWHSSGNALDLSGPANQMLTYARHLSDTAGGGLAELIHTPLGGAQIKNGKPFVYSGQVAADHYDHVHVADPTPPGSVGSARGGSMTAGGLSMGAVPTVKARKSGLPGVMGAMADAATAGYARAINDRLAAASGGAGAGTDTFSGGKLSFNSVARLAESVGLPGVTFAQIAKGESGFNPRAVGHDPGGTQGLGLWQITTGYNDDIIKQFGGRGAMFNPRTNALAAKAIYDRAGIGAWYGTKYMTGSNLHFQGDGPGMNVNFRGAPQAPRSTVIGGINVGIPMNVGRMGSAGEGRMIAQEVGEAVAAKIAAALREAPMTPLVA